MSRRIKAITLVQKQKQMYITMRENLKNTLGVKNKKYKKFRLTINEEIQILDYILWKLGGTNE